MKFRKKMSRYKSKKSFRRGTGVHVKNSTRLMSRGGIRL